MRRKRIEKRRWTLGGADSVFRTMRILGLDSSILDCSGGHFSLAPAACDAGLL